MATHIEEFNVQRITWESKVPVKVAIARLDAEVNAATPLHFEKLMDDLVAKGADWKTMNAKFNEVVGRSGFMFEHNHHSHEYRALYNPEAPYRETHLYSLVPPIETYSILYDNLSTSVVFPHRVLVLERDDGTASVHYDLPSSMIDISKNEEVKKLALAVDAQLESLIARILTPQSAKL